MSADLPAIYRSYIDCLNRRAWDELGDFVRDDVVRNGEPIGLSGYREMLDRNVRQIPDLSFSVQILVCDADFVAARLQFDCRPGGGFLGLAVDGRRISFAENVIYRFAGGKIGTVWSVIDKAAVEAQLR